MLLVRSLAVVALLATPAFAQLGEGPTPTDCSIRESRFSDRKLPLDDSTCLRASDVQGCISPDMVPTLWRAAPCLILDTSAELCEGAGTFDMTVYLTNDDVTLDCNGNRISHAEPSGGRHGIRGMYARSLSDITIRECVIDGVGGYGIDLKRFFRGEELDGPMTGHQRITIEDSLIQHTGRHGIYVGQNSRDVSIDNVVFSDNFIGVYLEAGSTGTRIADSVFYDSRNGPGVSVDSSAQNTIEHSAFMGNAGGAVQLYKNCGEIDGQVCPIRRELGADNNVIRFNDFWEDNVVLASRQFKLTVDHSWCLDVDVATYYRDHASNNVVYQNNFHAAKLDIQDEPNVAYGNVFTAGMLEIGTSDPIGRDPIVYTGAIAENVFDEGWIASYGSRWRAFENVDIYGNVDGDGACVLDADQWLAPSSPECLVSSTPFGCYANPRAIPGATCEPRPELAARNWDLVVPFDAWGGGETDLFAYDRAAGVGEVYRLSSDGTMELLFGWNGLRTTWHTIVGGDFDGDGAGDDLLFWDRGQRDLELYRIEQSGEMARLASYDQLTAWTSITPLDLPSTRHTDLLFHDTGSGNAELDIVSGAGEVRAIGSFIGLGRTWQQLVPGDFDGDGVHDDVFFYDPSRSLGRFYAFSDAGTRALLRSYPELGATWTRIAPVELDDMSHTDLVFYDGAARTGEFRRVTGAAQLATVRTHTNWHFAWTRIVAGDIDTSHAGADELFFHDGSAWRLYTVSNAGAISLLDGAGTLTAGPAQPPPGGVW